MRIITGRAKTGKSTYIYDEVNNEINSNTSDNLILIVPDLMTYKAEYDIIQRLNCDGIMNVEVLSFKRLASKILEELGGVKTQDINIYGKIMLLKEIFEENSKDLKLFKKASNQEGFLREFNLLIQELKQNQVSTSSLEDVSNKIDNYLLKAKLHDINLIFTKYNEWTLDKYFDEEDKFELVISMIKHSNYIKHSKIWIDGFESFNYQRLMLIKNLEDYSKGVTLTLNVDSAYLKELESYDDWEAFKTIYDTYESLKEIIEDIEIVPLSENKNPSQEISLIERNLFSLYLDECCDSTDKIALYSSMNPYTETEKTAVNIVSLVRDHNYRWKDIKVAVGNMDSYRINIKKIFDKYEIPYFLDVKRDIMNAPLTKYILSLLDIFIWNFKYDNVFELLKTGLSPIGENNAAILENYALQYGIEGSKWFDEIKSSVIPEYIEEIRKAFVSNFVHEIKEFKGLSTNGEITNFIFSYLRKHKVREKLQIAIEQFKKERDYESTSEYSQVWNSVMEVFEQILLVGQDSEISPLEYRKILEAGLKEVQISVIPPTLDTVEIGDISRIAVNSTKALFIIGANEGNFEAVNERGLLLEEEREALLDNNIKLINGSNFAFFKDKHMLYKAFSSPTERLFISYALGSTDGKSLQPSLYIDTLKRLFPNIKEETDISGNNELEYISNYKGTYDILIENIRRYLNGSEIDDIWKEVYNWYKNNDAERMNLINQGFTFKNSIEGIKPEIMNGIYDDDIYLTVSKLETYAECHFKYFIENVLKPKERLTQKIEYYDLGNINHEVLEDFINELSIIHDKINNLSYEDIDELISKSIDKVLEKQSKKVTAFDANNRNKYLKEKIQRVLNRTAHTLVTHLQRSEYKPRYTELQIGIIDEKDEKVQKGIYLDYIDIPAEDKTVRLRGKIDRVDVYEDENGQIYISIIDYKSSSKDIDLLYASEGIQIQLLVYLNAIIENGEKLFGKKPKVGGVFYYNVDDPIINKQCTNIEDEILKSLKLRGYALRDKELIKKMDKTLAPKAISHIIPAGIKDDGDFNGNCTKALTQEEFEKLLLFIQDKCKELASNILNGDFEINPYKKSNITPCTYCDYIGICKFDRELGNKYRFIKSMNQANVLNIILEKGGELKGGVDEGTKTNN